MVGVVLKPVQTIFRASVCAKRALHFHGGPEDGLSIVPVMQLLGLLAYGFAHCLVCGP